jgi:hypothetical protein
MIGSKTLVTSLLFTAGVVTAIVFGILSPERLANRGLGTLFVVGCFGVVVGTLMFRFWRLGERSRHYFRWATEEGVWASADETHFLGSQRRRVTIGNNRGEAFDLPPRAQHLLCVAVALLLALGCIDSRALGLLDRFEHSRTTISSSYCPAPEADAPASDPNAPGCELIRRAFALGYADSLGECAPKKKRASPSALCTRRQLDEPMFHYAWRLLSRTWSGLVEHTEASYFAGLRRDFGQRVGHLSQLRAAQRQVLASAPHAAHHIWTNLPDPGDGAFRAESCADRYRWMPHRPAATGASKVFEHVVAQLLFESRYAPSAGTCREYHVHWNAPLDSCQRIAANPDAVLGALDGVRAVLERHRLSQDLATRGKAPALEPAAFASFQCYFETGERARSSTAFAFSGRRFTVEELRVPPAPANAALYIDRYDAVARLLVHGFHYGALLSEAGLESGSAEGLQAAFAGHDYLLTRLYGLDSLDLYLDAGWLAARPDLLEVYPYQRHLKNYVQIFRRQYQRERGRL